MSQKNGHPGGPARDGVLLTAVESLDRETIDWLRALAAGDLRLAITHHRAHAMGLYPAPAADEGRTSGSRSLVDRSNGGSRPDVSISLNGESRPDQILRMSSALGKYPAASRDLRSATEAERGGLILARLGGLLPAVVTVRVNPDESETLRDSLAERAILDVTTEQISALAREPGIEVVRVSDAPVPLEEAENARFMLFREANGLLEHVAIMIGDRESWPDPVPVRIHSACLTGDLFGSLRCDCGEQLRGSLRVFTARGGGVLLYLAQEGRGIGLGNKLRAYALQQQGLDTVDADCALGFGADERRYDVAVEMLRHLEVERVHLLTNNPEKVNGLREGGIRVVYRQPLHGTLNRHNLPYVRAKVQRAGHWLGDMLSGAIPGE